MAALRISRPGVVGTTLIDIGPAVGRSTHTRGAIFGGQIVVGGPLRRTVDQTLAAARAASRPSAVVTKPANRGPLCEKPMPVIKATCGRKRGHRDSCRSRAVMDADAAARRGQRIPRDVVYPMRNAS